MTCGSLSLTHSTISLQTEVLLVYPLSDHREAYSKSGLVLVQNQVDPKASIAEEIVWREVSGHSTKLMRNRYITQRPSLREETEKVNKSKGSRGGHSGGHF